MLGGWIVFVTVIVALSAGMPWKRLLHWAGAVLLVAGIVLAARGISDVRREWTTRPGWVAVTRTRFWLAWNWFARSSAMRVLRVPQHQFAPVQISATSAIRLNAQAVLTATWVPPAGASYKARIEWLEERMTQASERFNEVEAAQRKETGDSAAGLQREQAARESAIAEVKKNVVDLAGGGLRLQAWSVACLIAGTILTAIY